MESFFTRYRNPSILALVLLAQILGLAVQVKRPLDPSNPDGGTVRLLRSWVIGAVTPVGKVFTSTGQFIRRTWHDYINVVGLRSENRDLRDQNEKLHLELARQADSANQAQRLQALLDFKQRFLTTTVAAQVVGSSGSEQSRVIYIDKGVRDGLRPGMAVITPHGIVGKIRDVYRSSAQVLMMNDATSGVGAILENSRLHGVVKGTPTGELMLVHIMADEKVAEGEKLVTSGGDRIFPKGLPVGTVSEVSRGSDLFLAVRIQPAANLSRLEEVLVITEMQGPNLEAAEEQAPVRASDILAERLPSVPKKPEPVPPKVSKKTMSAQAIPGQAAGSATPGAQSAAASSPAPGSTGGTASGVSTKPRSTAASDARAGSWPPNSVDDASSKPNDVASQPATETSTSAAKPAAPKTASPKPNTDSPAKNSDIPKAEKPAAKPPATTEPEKPAEPEARR